MKSKPNYAGIPDKYARLDDAKVVLIPIPYLENTSSENGADNGPDAFLQASENMKLYDIETKSEVYKKGIYLAPAVTEKSSPEKMVDTVYKTIKTYLQQEKFVTLFGGEHAVSIGSIRAFNEHFEDLTVVQVGAHANLRPSVDGSSCNSACALHEASQNTNLIQVGIRSMDSAEVEYLDEGRAYFAHDLYDEWMDDAIGQMTPNVFVTIDLHAFDPSIMPSVKTPETGGLFWYETLDFLKLIFKKKNVVGFDIVELSPNEKEKSSDSLAAKLYYKMLCYKFYTDRILTDEDEE